MSTTIDERVVSMQFDNKHFEKNVSTTMSTLEKLKQSLKFTNATKGLESIKSATDEVVKSEYEAYQSGFRLRDVWLKTASIFEYQVAGRIIGAAKNMVSALTIDPIKTGLAEYETQLNSVQTILANTKSKGSTLEDVNAALDELNLYADKTIYNFTEMTRNIGTFTAAGVDLDTSVSAIKGIANLAAVSGSTSQQASTAMYQLSQALSSGTVRLMDWNSVVNAGMGGEVFQNALKETAKVHGVAIDEIIKKNGSFRESLKDEWLSAEILTETLAKFTGDLSEEQLKSMGYTEKQIDEIMELGQTANDAATKVKTFTQLMDTLKEAAQSGWSQTWRTIIGDFEEAKELWTKASDVFGGIIGASADARNELVSGTFNSGWDKFLGEGNIDEEKYTYHVKKVAKEQGVAIDEMIKNEGSLEAALRKGFAENTISTDVLSIALNRMSSEYQNLSDEELKAAGYTKEQIKDFAEFNEKIQNGSISLDEYAEKMKKLSGRELLFSTKTFKREDGIEVYLGAIPNILKAIGSLLKPIKDAWREIFPKTTADQLYNILEAFRNFTSNLIIGEEKAEKLKQTFKGVFAVLDIIVTVIKTVIGSVVKLFGNFSSLSDLILTITSSIANFVLGIRNTIKESNILSTVAGAVTNAIQNTIDAIKSFAGAVKEKFSSSGFEGFVSVVKGVWNFVKTIFSNILGLMNGTFTGNNNIFSVILDVLTSGLLLTLVTKIKGFVEAFEEVGSAFGDLLENITGPLQAFQAKLKAEALKKIATALLILVGALLILSLIEQEKLEGAIAAMAISLGVLSGALLLIGKTNISSTKGIGKFVTLASSLLILALALKLLATMSWSDIGRGLTAMTGALLVFTGILALTALVTKIGDNNSIKQIKKITNTLLVLSISLKILSTISWDGIARGLTAMGGSLLIFTGVLALTALVSKIGDDNSIKYVKKIAWALLIVSVSLKLLATMSWSDIGRGLTAMTGALLILTGVLALTALVTKIGKNKVTGQLVVITTFLMGLALSLKLMATMSWDEIGRGLAAMGGSLLILVGTITLLSLISKISGKAGMVVVAASLLILTAALSTLIPVLMILGNMKTTTLAKGLIAIAAALAIFGAASVLLQSAVPAMLALAAAMTLLGISMTLIGAGIALMMAGMAAMLTGLAALITAIIAGGVALVTSILGIIRGIVEMIPLILVSIATGIVEFCKVIADGAPAIGDAIVSVLLSVIDAAVRVIPELTAGLLKIFLGILQSLADYIPEIVGAVMDLLIGIVYKLFDYIPDIVGLGLTFFTKVFDGIVEALGNMDSDKLLKGVLSIGIIAGLVALLASIAGMIPMAMVGVLGLGVIIAELALVLAAVGQLTRIPGLLEFVQKGGDILEAIGTAIGQFVGGIIGGIAKGITSALPDMAKDLSDFMVNLQPFLDGIKSLDSNMLSNAKTLAGVLLTLTATSLLNQLTSWLTGGVSISKFANDLVAFGKGIKGFSGEVEGINAATITPAAEAGKKLAEMASSIPSSGGLWQLIAGGTNLSSFSQQIKSFGKGISSFAEQTSGVSFANVEPAAKAGKTLAEMMSSLPTTGGLWQMLAGGSNLVSFSSQIKSFGKGIAGFVSSVSDVSFDKVGPAAEAGKKLADMAKSIPTAGGLFDNGKRDMNHFKSQLIYFGEAISKFSSLVSEVSFANVDAAAKAGKTLAEMASVIPAKGELNIKNFAKDLDDLAKGIVNFVSELGDTNLSGIAGTVDEFKSVVQNIKTVAEQGIQSIASTFTNGTSSIVAAISGLIASVVVHLTMLAEPFTIAGQIFMKKLIEGVLSAEESVKTAFSTVVSSGTAAITSESVYLSFHSAGLSVAKGFANGIASGAFQAVLKARAMASAALKAAKEALGINSPSREFYSVGEFGGMGLVNAFNDYESNAYNASYSMAQKAIDGLKKPITKIKDLIENGIDANPTITPVLDLSNVNAGMSKLGGLFNTNPSVGVLSRLGSISSLMKNQNGGSNSDITSAIDRLAGKIDNASGNTYNINGITYDSGSEVASAIEVLVRAANIDKRR